MYAARAVEGGWWRVSHDRCGGARTRRRPRPRGAVASGSGVRGRSTGAHRERGPRARRSDSTVQYGTWHRITRAPRARSARGPRARRWRSRRRSRTASRPPRGAGASGFARARRATQFIPSRQILHQCFIPYMTRGCQRLRARRIITVHSITSYMESFHSIHDSRVPAALVCACTPVHCIA